MTGLLIRGARPVLFRSRSELGRLRARGPADRAGLSAPPAPDGPTDLRIEAGTVLEMGPALARHGGEEILDAGGAFVIPGLWDAHALLRSGSDGGSDPSVIAVSIRPGAQHPPAKMAVAYPDRMRMPPPVRPKPAYAE